MTPAQLDSLSIGQKVTVYTVDHRAHTGYVGDRNPAAITLHVTLSPEEHAEFVIPLVCVLYWCEFFDAHDDPVLWEGSTE